MKYSNDFQTARQNYLNRLSSPAPLKPPAAPSWIQNGRIAADYINNPQGSGFLRADPTRFCVQNRNPGQGENPNANPTVEPLTNHRPPPRRVPSMPPATPPPPSTSTAWYPASAKASTCRFAKGGKATPPTSPATRLRTRKACPRPASTQRMLELDLELRRHQTNNPSGHTNHTRGYAGIRHARAVLWQSHTGF